MFNKANIITSLQGAIGFRQNPDPQGPQIGTSGAVDLTASSSGYYVTDEHPILDTINLISVCPDYQLYQNDPALANQAFTDWLKSIIDTAIIRSLDTWYNEKLKDKTANTLLEKDALFYEGGALSNTDINAGKRVYLELFVKKSNSLIVTLSRVGFQFSQAESFTAYFYELGKQDAIKSIPINYTNAGDFEWFSIPDGLELEGGKTYYLSYDQNDISSESINAMMMSHYSEPGVIKYPSTKYLTIASGLTNGTGVDLWDIAANQYTLTSNYGMNLDYQVACDYSKLIEDNVNEFCAFVSLTAAIMLLHRLAFNPQARVNRNLNNITTQTLLYELDGDSQGRPGGLRKRYEDMLNRLKFDLSTLDKICLKCKEKGRIKRRVG